MRPSAGGSGGLQTVSFGRGSSGGGLTSLARLAVESGGRYTERTNDLTLAYARAQRDLGCIYTLGFYLPEEAGDRPRNLVVNVLRPGLRALHPRRYGSPPNASTRDALLHAAWMAPEMFESGVVRAHLFPVRPASKRSWNALLAVSFPVALAGTFETGAAREFGAVLQRGAVVRARFARRIALQPVDEGVTSEPEVTFVEEIELEPGTYTLTAVLSEPGATSPHAVKLQVELPEIPRKELFLVEPLLGRPAGPNLVVHGIGPQDARVAGKSSFQPLLVLRLDEPDDLVAVTQACYVGSKKGPPDKLRSTASIRRALLDPAAGTIGELPPVSLEFEDAPSVVQCQNLVDVLPASALRAGEYTFEAQLSNPRAPEPLRETVRFSIGPSTTTSDTDR